MQLRLNSPLRWLSRGLLGWQASFCLPRWLALLGCMALMPVAAQPSTQALTQRCWADSSVWRTRPDLREPMSVRIGNLRNGDTVPSPFWLDFGVRGMGIIPAGTAHAAAGHHHVLLDTPLPMSHVDKIPFSNNYRHFGKGQTGTLLELPPGRHTLRLLFADHEHRPYFVYSPEISFTVEGARTDPAPVVSSSDYAQTCQRWLAHEMTRPRTTEPHIYLRNVRANDVLPALSVIALGVVGLGVAPSDAYLAGSGHFELIASKAGEVAQVQRLVKGNTETLLELTPGDYQLQVNFVDANGKKLLTPVNLPVRVTNQPG
ncbi:MAG: DUF4399 domain-containing protein [Rhodoferax sp.]|nr:DUF4399 domain-containing protein [Rhodoferax sp.]